MGELENLFRCATCDLSFGEPGPLNEHIESCHPLDLKIDDELNLKIEENDGEDENTKNKFQMETWEKDLEKMAPKRNLKCQYCGKIFQSKWNHIRHEGTHTGFKPFICGICGKAFSQNKNMKAHERLHTNEQPFACEKCGKKYNELRNLRDHMWVHTGEKLFSCENCQKKFSQRRGLMAHIESVHKNISRFSCETCGESYKELKTLKNHQLNHTSKKTVPCNYCGKKFFTEELKNRHEKTHTSTEEHPCMYCKEICQTRWFLKKHLLTCKNNPSPKHPEKDIKRRKRSFTKKKELFTCESCGKQFKETKFLESHQWVHTG